VEYVQYSPCRQVALNTEYYTYRCTRQHIPPRRQASRGAGGGDLRKREEKKSVGVSSILLLLTLVSVRTSIQWKVLAHTVHSRTYLYHNRSTPRPTRATCASCTARLQAAGGAERTADKTTCLLRSLFSPASVSDRFFFQGSNAPLRVSRPWLLRPLSL
jgi:hypothetical protein